MRVTVVPTALKDMHALDATEPVDSSATPPYPAVYSDDSKYVCILHTPDIDFE